MCLTPEWIRSVTVLHGVGPLRAYDHLEILANWFSLQLSNDILVLDTALGLDIWISTLVYVCCRSH